MDKKDIITFFNEQAPKWDAEMIRNDTIINEILKNSGIKEGISVLDVACGTGVLFQDYFKIGVSKIVGVDISPKMVEIAKKKFSPTDNLEIICGDIENLNVDIGLFDCCMVYNAFPHFPEPEHLIMALSGYLKTGGRLSVAHGMSRENIDMHHSHGAHKVSMGLIDVQSLAEIFSKYFYVDIMISNENMYQVSGIKK